MPTPPRLPESFVTLSQVAKRLATSRRSVRRWLTAAGVPAFFLGNGKNGSVRYAADAVESWLHSRKEKT